MRIGIVSDTHNNLKNCRRIVELFNQSGVERIVHTGDITQAKTIEIFSQLAVPMYGVYGNNDQERASLDSAMIDFGFNFIDPPLTLEWAERRMVVVHDPLELSMVNPDDYDVVLHGHTHRETIEFDGDQLTFNPGECAGMMEGYNAIGVLDLVSITPEIIRF